MIGMPAVFDGADVRRDPHDALRQQESCREGAIFTGRPHDHGERLPVETHLEGLLDRREIVGRSVSSAPRTSDPCYGDGAVLPALRLRTIVRHDCEA